MTKILSIVLTITVFLLFTQTTFAGDKITPYSPETKQTPAIEEVKEEKGGVSWLWIILGVVAVGGGVAVAAGGGSSSSNSSGSTGGTSGTVTVGY
ncbi:MAG TPA: hypothetical protein DCQ99_08695 [Nitrospinae bacterium]|nr:hypothetical protein [Nitrospinota bacterium]HBA25834.1 hypothetical protein [Nitrospinota bacterium]